MIRLLVSAVIYLVANAIGLLVANALLDDMSVDGSAFVIAVLIFVLYLNGISVTQSWIQQGRVSFWGGLLGIHATVWLVTLAFFIRRVWLLRWVPAWMLPGHWRVKAER